MMDEGLPPGLEQFIDDQEKGRYAKDKGDHGRHTAKDIKRRKANKLARKQRKRRK